MKKHNKPLVFSLLSTTEVRTETRRVTDFPIFNDAEEAVDAARSCAIYSLRVGK